MLLCSFISLTNVQIIWEYPNGNVETNNDLIVIDSVTTANDGVYSCMVQNEGGFDNASISIDVFGESFNIQNLQCMDASTEKA